MITVRLDLSTKRFLSTMKTNMMMMMMTMVMVEIHFLRE